VNLFFQISFSIRLTSPAIRIVETAQFQQLDVGSQPPAFELFLAIGGQSLLAQTLLELRTLNRRVMPWPIEQAHEATLGFE